MELEVNKVVDTNEEAANYLNASYIYLLDKPEYLSVVFSSFSSVTQSKGVANLEGTQKYISIVVLLFWKFVSTPSV